VFFTFFFLKETHTGYLKSRQCGVCELFTINLFGDIVGASGKPDIHYDPS